MTQTITRQSTIGTIIDDHPEVIEILLGYGVHCVGCGVSQYESLEDGLRGHQFDEEKIDTIVRELNKIIKENNNNNNNNKSQETQIEDFFVTISNSAVEKIKQFCEKGKKSGLRISIIPGGCSGFGYKFDLVNEPKENDTTIERNGAKIFITKESLEKMNGSEIDYLDSLTNAGFKVHNPQTSACGCGASFEI